MIFITKQWACPICSFPENFTPECANCNYANKQVKPENN